MNAKEALLFELGDLFSTVTDEKVDDMVAVSESGEDGDGDFFLTEETADIEPREDNEGEVEEETIEQGVDKEPPDLFASPSDTSDDGYGDGDEGEIPISDMSDKDIDGCIDAATEAITTVKMPKEQLDWGLGYLRKMFDEKIARLQRGIDAIDWDAVAASYAETDEEEAEKRQEERDRLISE